MNSPMAEKYVTVSWCPADVQDIRPDWSDEKCMEMLQQIARNLEELSIEKGWDILENLLDYEEYM